MRQIFVLSLAIYIATTTASKLDPEDEKISTDVDPLDILGLSIDIDPETKQSKAPLTPIGKLKIKSSELYLPKHVVPISYKLKIRPILYSTDPQEFLTAPGTVEILVACKNATDSITLHAHTQKFVKIMSESVKIKQRKRLEKAKEIAVISHSTEEKDDANFYKITLDQDLQPGEEYWVKLDFVSRISNTSLSGLYFAKYTDPESKEERRLAVTQFEDIAARQMFPCFDEPSLKATFQMTISRLANQSSMSNMPMEYTKADPDNDGYFLDHYFPTPPMSSYLVALVVSDYKCVTASRTLYNKTVEACGPPHLVVRDGGADHAATISAKILNFYEDLWQMPYPLPKMQSVAIPTIYFEAGAMENYGLNTYRFSALLYFPHKSTESSRNRVEEVIAHELAHQWFGNLITTKTWNHIFLNEGFATFVSVLGVEEVSPEFKFKENGWYSMYFQRALRTDAALKGHPVVKVDDYFGDFDSISYSKGASLIKMMENILTYDTLIGGLQKYLKKFAFSNVEYTDLFDTLNNHVLEDGEAKNVSSIGYSLKEIMEPWTIQQGFPLIRVQWTFQKLFHFSQERFVQRPLVETKSNVTIEKDQTSLWHCPIFIQGSKILPEAKPTLWLSNKESIKAWTTHENLDWILVNHNSKAFFRVLYDEKSSLAINQQLARDLNVFSPISRAQYIDDAFECAFAQYSTINVALDTTSYLSKESDTLVWKTALYHFGKIYNIFSSSDKYRESFNNFKDYLRPRLNFVLESIGVEQESTERGRIVIDRGTLLQWGAALELPNVLNYAQKLVGERLNTSIIPVDIRSEILCAGVIGDKTTAEAIRDFYNKIKDDEGQDTLRSQLVLAAGCTRDQETIKRLLKASIDSKFMASKSDSLILLQKLAANPISRRETFNHLQNNFDGITKYFGKVDRVYEIFSTFSKYWSTKEELSTAEEFISTFSTELEPIMKKMNGTIDGIRENIKWVQVFQSDINDWMKAKNT